MIIKGKYKKNALVLIACLLVSCALVNLTDSAILFSAVAIVYTAIGTIAFLFLVEKSDFSKIIKLIVLAGYFLRLFIDYSNAFFIDIWNIFSPTADAGWFYKIAHELFYGNDISEGHVYPKLIAAVFRLTGPSELMAYYISTLAWMLVICIVSRNYIKTKHNDILIAIFTFMPVNIWLNTSSLRESIQVLFLSLATVLLLRWMDTGSFKYMLFSVTAVLIATTIHFGVVLLYFSILLLCCIWSCKEQKWQLNIKISVMSILIIGTFLWLFLVGIFDDMQPYIKSSYLQNGVANMLINKDYFVSNTTYLADFEVTAHNFIFWVFLKWLYFWISPVLWNAAGVRNWLIIVFDVIPIVLIHYICIFKSHASKYVNASLILTIPSGFFYAMGTVAAGTAMRHRNIFLAILIVCYIYGEKKAKEVNEQNII